ncbi:MAG: GIY-YIG nuclease family protein [Minisyncoccia bacterium]
MFYTYILKSKKDDELYIGSTNDLKRRIREHTAGSSHATSWRGPFRLVYYEAYTNEKDARSREYSLKRRGNARAALLKRIQRSVASV